MSELRPIDDHPTAYCGSCDWAYSGPMLNWQVERHQRLYHLARPTDGEWQEAVAEVRARYPEDVFPDNGTSIDAASGRFARLICDEIVRAAEAAHERRQDG